MKNTSSLTGLLGIAFVVLKLCHVINWSWWWVTCPFWGGFVIAIVAFAIWLPLWLREKRREARAPKMKSRWQERLEELKKQRAN